ncbi:MAG: FecR domain-containing protein, partial [Deltaproteobacteria bacterium]|nr:FecR domain-containing protein [Deltaproteobacteria bacterium]
MQKRWQWFKSTVRPVCRGTGRYLGLALFIPGLVYAQQQPAGVVTGLQGQAQLTRQAAPSPLPLRFKDGVIIRDVIDTREKSLARILFGGRSTVTVRELSRLEVREEILPTGAKRDVYDLSSGAILVNVARQLMRPGDEVIIRTPNAVASVRGSTIFCQCILVPVIQCNLALRFGSAIVTPDGRPPVTLTPNTSLNVTGTGPGVQATQTTITQAQANQILVESQVGKVVKEEANPAQIAQTHTQIAAELATAVIEATTQTGATTLETTASETKAAETGETTTTGTESTKADITPDTSKTTQGDQQVVVSSPKTLQGTETLKTFDQSGSWTGSYPIVEVTGTTVDRASEGNLIQVNSGVEFTLDGTLLQITDSTITDSGVLAVSGILKNTSTETLIVIDPTTID